MFKAYYQLTKPGIIYGNVLTAAAGFLFGSRGLVRLGLLVALLLGTSLVIGSACVFNNYIDRGIDKRMARTKARALVSGEISGRGALMFAVILGLCGFAILIAWTNWAVVLVGAVAFVDYVVLYGLAKRQSVYGTLVGSISGSAPIVAGYVAATNQFDGAALLLFLILAAWQMPHFYAIATYRYDDYKAAGLPVLPVARGMKNARRQIVWYVCGFVLCVILLSATGRASVTFGVIMAAVGGAWLLRGFQGFRQADQKAWARNMFLTSLVVILALSATLSIDSFLP